MVTEPTTPPADQTYVLLGASNLDMSLGRLVHAISEEMSDMESAQILAASGHGRSYGRSSQVLVRRLPGILQCGLWGQLQQIPEETQVKSIVTDIGNDLIFGAPVSLILGWVEECLQRLSQQNSEIVLTALPLESLLRLSNWRFMATQKLFFPFAKTSHAEMVEKVKQLNAELQQLAEHYSAVVVEQPLEWFGFDPIHFKRSQRATVWQHLCTHWSSFDAEAVSWNGRSHTIHGKLVQQERWWFKRLHKSQQPCYSLPNLSVFVY